MTLVDSTLSPLLGARAALASAIQSATGYACHDSYTPAIASPCVVLESDGWQRFAASQSAIYRVRVTVLYASKDIADMSNGVEELARLVWLAGKAAGWDTADVPAPGAVTFAGQEYAGVQFLFAQPLEME